MKSKFKVWIASYLLLMIPAIFPESTFGAAENKLLGIMEEELKYNLAALRHADSAELYFLSYQVTEEREYSLAAELGTITRDDDNHNRYLDVIARVGSPALDNTHEIPDDGSGGIGPRAEPLPLENDETALKMKLWNETDRRFREAQKRFTNVLTYTAVKVEAEDTSADFSSEQPSVYIGAEVSLQIDKELWRSKLKRFSEIFKNYPEIQNSSISLSAIAQNNYFVSSEGTRIQDGLTYIRLFITCSATAEDGMRLTRNEGFDAASFANLPTDEIIWEAINKIIDELIALKTAPLAEPYSGPAILVNRASGVFFHEIFGHRIEGHRQKSEFEGQTFAKKVGEKILPDFISVYSDPTIQKYGNIDLRGFYRYDDEGIKARRVTVVDKGILRNFLLSRSPIENFPVSNGHGRKYRGFDPVARQSNLIIESERTVTYQELKQMLREECRRQNKPYGLIFCDISGGFTMTGRYMPQAFKVIPLLVYKLYVDDGREELIRGVDIVGTPLTSFGKIIMAADDPLPFNGTCGAESGWVPVSAVSPSLLLSEIEIERSQKGQDRPPLIPSPLPKQP